MITNETAVGTLNYLARTYAGITQLIASTKQRLQSLPGETPPEDFDSVLKGESKVDGLETVKGRLTRELGKQIAIWPIWELWLKNVPGIGPALASFLIIYYYYRFVPVCQQCGGDLQKIAKSGNGDEEKKAGAMVCQKCGKKAKEGLLKYRMEVKDFATISKWWKYMGRHTVEGVQPKRKKGVLSDWGTPKRTLGFHIGDQFNRQDDNFPYKAFFLERKRKHERNHTDWTKGHVHNAARNETVKLFLAHFWTVARTIDEMPLSEPYAGAIMGHTNLIKPFYWGSENDFETQPDYASQPKDETQRGDASHPRRETYSLVASQEIVETPKVHASQQKDETQFLPASHPLSETQPAVAKKRGRPPKVKAAVV